MYSDLETAFRELRERWFNRVLRQYEPEREWEDKEATVAREGNNVSLKRLYDEDTDALVSGNKRAIAPRCQHDIFKARSANEKP